MTPGNEHRPSLRLQRWAWRSPGAPDLPGIGLFRGTRTQAHLTPDEARTLADKLHDMADRLEEETR